VNIIGLGLPEAVAILFRGYRRPGSDQALTKLSSQYFGSSGAPAFALFAADGWLDRLSQQVTSWLWLRVTKSRRGWTGFLKSHESDEFF